MDYKTKKGVTLYGYQRDLLADVITREIARTARIKAEASEIGCGSSNYEDRLAHLRQLLDLVVYDD